MGVMSEWNGEVSDPHKIEQPPLGGGPEAPDHSIPPNYSPPYMWGNPPPGVGATPTRLGIREKCVGAERV
jgi:hypothetical protein